MVRELTKGKKSRVGEIGLETTDVKRSKVARLSDAVEMSRRQPTEPF